ncbi:conserved hypothetical protein [Trichinella spiralis]|uniref:hypothetical protein n=1 Tax=Trichinella spiralis TaxID=6334 RepID=UPI0001EFD532|nr:conserved hypothetical protein [Trichinella spiralis]
MKRDVSVSWPNLAEISSRTPSTSFSICCLIKSHSLTASSQSVEACQLSFADNGVDLAATASHGVHKHFADGSRRSCSGDDGTPMKLAVDRGAPVKLSKSVECVGPGTVRVNLGCSKSEVDLSQLSAASRLSEKRFSLGDQSSLAQRLHDSSNEEDPAGTTALTANPADQQKELLKFVDNAVHLDRSFSSTPSIDVDSSLAYFAVLPRGICCICAYLVTLLVNFLFVFFRQTQRSIQRTTATNSSLIDGGASNYTSSATDGLTSESCWQSFERQSDWFIFKNVQEKKQHVWLQCQEKAGLNCDICNKAEGNYSFVRCTDSSSSVIGQIYAETSNRSGPLPQSADCVISVLPDGAEDALLKDEILKAEQAVKKLVANVDQGIGDIQLQQLCKEIVAQMDTKESTTFLGKTFTKNELLSNTRTLLHAGDVYWQNAMRKPTAAPSHAEMYEIICHTKKMLASWTERIQRAVDVCPPAGKVNSCNDELKKLLDCQIEAYGEILIMKTIDECLPAKIAATAVARFADLMSQLVRERCKQQLLNLACPADTATAQTTTSSDGSNINRSQTFHGMRNDSKKSIFKTDALFIVSCVICYLKVGFFETFLHLLHIFLELYRKRVTVSGIPQRCEENRIVETAIDNGMSGEIHADSKSAFCAVMSRLKDAEIELDGMKHEKAMLLIELEKEKSIRSSSAQNVYNAGLEELRRLHSDFEKRRSEFQQLVDEKKSDFEHRENAIREKEERLNREDSELQSKWQCLREAWEKLQLSGVPIRSLTSPLAPSTSCAAYIATCNSSTNASNPVNHPAAGGDNSNNSGPIGKQSNSTVANSTPTVGVDDSSNITCVRSGVGISGGSTSASAEKQSFRKVQVPPYLLGSFVHSGRLPDDLVRQQLPSKLLKDDMFNSLSSRFQSSMKERRKGSPKVKDNHSINVKGKQK